MFYLRDIKIKMAQNPGTATGKWDWCEGEWRLLTNAAIQSIVPEFTLYCFYWALISNLLLKWFIYKCENRFAPCNFIYNFLTKIGPWGFRLLFLLSTIIAYWLFEIFALSFFTTATKLQNKTNVIFIYLFL